MRVGFVRRSLAGSLSLAALAGLGVLMATPRDARANGFEIPENGTEVMGRAGAWTARADTALATALNPAGLAGQKTNIIVNSNFTYQSQCFARAGNYPTGSNRLGTQWTSDVDFEGKPYPEVCKKNGIGNVGVVPQLGATFQINDKVSIGFLPLWTPSGTGKAVWPTEVTLPSGDLAPAPQRFLLVSKNARIIMPTLGVGVEVLPGLRVGASFQWVITMFESQLMSQGPQSSVQDVQGGPGSNTMSTVKWTKLFTPAAVFGAMYSPHDDFDIGAMFRYSADVKYTNTLDGKPDVTVQAPFYGRATKPSDTPAITEARIKEMVLKQPMDLRLGFRWHPKRKSVSEVIAGRRDFLKHDQFDIELDLNYSRNSSFDRISILFYENQAVNFGSATAGFVPPNASLEKQWQDTFAVKLGGEYAVVKDTLGIRAGAFFQTKGQDEKFLNLDFHPGTMFGFYLGGTFRISRHVDIAAGYGHIFVGEFDNTNKGGGAVRGLVATPPNAPTAANPNPPLYDACTTAGLPQPDQAYRACSIANTGRLKTGYNMFSLGATFRF